MMDAEAAAFFRRSYSAVDGLWFLMVEEVWGFEAALEVDVRVWEVMPKIQARELRRLIGAPGGLEGLRQCLARKLEWEGFCFESVPMGQHALQFLLRECPWHAAMVRSGREHLAGRVGERICTVEFSVWAREFSDEGQEIHYALQALRCQGAPQCVLAFHLAHGRDELTTPASGCSA